ncbi:unnamed protein product [Caenorhabditis auriculariae]|uniref:EGF-like domain-containing protein n=1 Tax=Caenorhabditis auriculariae TaxID=2777116 RepID=A0A8S1HL52_9PELO|nr:unnamed protein product [Caenorhabditis auriculariae]
MIILTALMMVLGITCERPKHKDSMSNILVKMSDIPVGSCGECDRWQNPINATDYEEYKCKVLRVHGKMSNGKCECEPSWKGPICNEYNGCPEGHSLFGSVCTANVCQHNGALAVGKKEIECICPVPWDGRYCERLACWRKTNHGQEKRYRNNGNECICGNHFTGEQCDVVTACLNGGQLDMGKCKCPDGWHGELCEKKCPKGKVTCQSSNLSFQVVFSLLSLYLLRFR